MKRTATLVAGLLLVTGTVFAAPSVTTTGEIVYENTVFSTDNAVLQNVADGDTQAFKAVLAAQFNDKNSLTLTYDEGNDPTVQLEYKYVGTENVFTATTKSDDNDDDSSTFTTPNADDVGLFQKTDLKVVHTKGNVVAQISGTVKADLYGAAPTGQATFDQNKDSDGIFIQYQVTPSVQTTFYPYATTFGVTSVFNDDNADEEILGIVDTRQSDKDYTDNLSVSEDAVAGIKVALTAGALKGLEVKVGTSADGTGKDAKATYFVDAKYSKTVGTVTLTGDFATTTDDDNAVKQTMMLDAKAKIATLDLQGQVFQAVGKASADDVTAIYGKATTKLAGIALKAEASSKKLGEQNTINGVYVEGAYTAKEINGIAPTVTLSYKDVDLKEKSVPSTVTAKVEAKIVKDGITVTPSLEVANGDDTTTTGTIKVAYSF